MKRITIALPDELHARLRLEAARRGTSMSAVAREAIERHLPASHADGRLGFLAVGEGSLPDASERVDDSVGRAMRRRRAPS